VSEAPKPGLSSLQPPMPATATPTPPEKTPPEVVVAVGTAAVAALLLTFLYPVPEAGPSLALPVHAVDEALLGKVRAVRAARLSGYAPGAAESVLGGALDAYQLREAVVARDVPAGAPPGRTARIEADAELARLSRALQGEIGTYLRARGVPAYAAYGSWRAEAFVAALARLVVAAGAPGAGTGTGTGAGTAAAEADPAAGIAALEAAADVAPVVGAFGAQFLERGLFAGGAALTDEQRERAVALYLWRWASLAGPTGPGELLDPAERLLYWRTVVEVDAPGDPAARLPRRRAALAEIAKLDAGYPVDLTDGVLCVRNGDLAGARAAFVRAAAAAPGDQRARTWLDEVDRLLGAARAPAPAAPAAP